MGVGAAPLVSRLDAQAVSGPKPRIAVIGAGAFGGWTALHLRRLGAEVDLVDSWGPGNARSSSGGDTRVIRAIYGQDRIYVEMVKRAYELWEHLIERASDLYVETGALWMHRGDDAYVQSSLSILQELAFPVDRWDVEEAKRRYPQIDFTGIKSVYFERRAGALSARRLCGVVREAFDRAGGSYRIARAEPGPIVSGAMSPLRLPGGVKLEADAYVFACGPWLGRLFPEVVGDGVRPTRQEVHYFGTPPGANRYLPASFPVWIDFGERIFYGIPDVHGNGFKVADDTRGESFDPTSGDRTPSKAGIERARGVLAERFPELAKAPLLEVEVCQYENSPDGHLIVDRHPAAKNVWIIGGGSGHGFKLAPAVGEMTAAAILSEKALPKLFRIDRIRDAAKPATQFESKRKGL